MAPRRKGKEDLEEDLTAIPTIAPGTSEMEIRNLGEPPPREPKKCRVKVCTVQTTNPTGYCQEHQKDYYSTITGESIKHCSSCLVKDTCPDAGNELGVCIHEIAVSTASFENREAIEHQFKHVLISRKRQLIRLEHRFATCQAEEMKGIHAELRLAQSDYQRMMIEYAKFMGWYNEERDKDIMKETIKSFRTVIGRKMRAMSDRDIKVKSKSNVELMVMATVDPGEIDYDPVEDDVTVDDDVQQLRELFEDGQEAEDVGDSNSEDEADPAL